LRARPRQPRLADAGDADGGDEVRAALLGRGVEELLDEAQLAVAADEGRLEPFRAQRAASGREHTERPEEGYGLGLPLELVLAGRLVGDRRLGRMPGLVTDEHVARLGGGLDARGGVDEVAGNHALA